MLCFHTQTVMLETRDKNQDYEDYDKDQDHTFGLKAGYNNSKILWLQ